MGAWSSFKRFMNSERSEPAQEQRAVTALPWDAGGDFPSQAYAGGDKALALIPVYAAIGMLARHVATTPIHAYRRDGAKREKMDSLPQLVDKLEVDGKLQDWLHRAVVSLGIRGNAVGIVLERDGYGYPTSIEWQHPDHVHVDDGRAYGPGSFRQPIWRVHGAVVPTNDIIHIPFFPVPGRVWGLSPLSAAAATVGMGLDAQDYASTWFRSGGVPPGTFRNTNKELDTASAEAVKQRLMAAIRRKQPLVYGNDWEFNPIAIAPADAQFVQSMRLTATQIAAIFDVPPERIGGETGGSMTYTSPEQASLHLITFSLRYWFERIEHCISAYLPMRQYVKFAVDAIYRADVLTRYSVYRTGIETGLLSRDECRAWEDLPPIPGGKGKSFDIPDKGLDGTPPQLRPWAGVDNNPATNPDAKPGEGAPKGDTKTPPGAHLPSATDNNNGAANLNGNGRAALDAILHRLA